VALAAIGDAAAFESLDPGGREIAVLQSIGRCTRALQDRSTIFVTGTELVDFLADDRKWRYFSPELQAELAFGVGRPVRRKRDADHLLPLLI
jgi:hypothetical protein